MQVCRGHDGRAHAIERVGNTSVGSGAAPGCLDVRRGSNRRASERHRMSAVSAGVRWIDIGADSVLAERIGGVVGYEASNQNSACGGSRLGTKVAGVHGSPSAVLLFPQSWSRDSKAARS